MRYSIVLLVGILCATTAFAAETTQPAKMRLGIGAVKIVNTLKQQMTSNGQGPAIVRAAETIDGQMMDALQNTRKFEIIARTDLEELLREQSIAKGSIIDPADAKAATPGKVRGIEYLVLTTIDDFVDVDQSTYSQEMQMAASRRVLRMSAVVKVYNTSTGTLLESMMVPAQLEITGTMRSAPGDAVRNAKATDDSIYTELVNQLAGRMAQRVTDIIYPAKVLSILGDTVTMNRGAGTSINRGEVWEVFAQGAELTDPDTGELLGHQESKMGEVVINEVTPKFSKAVIQSPNQGIAAGMIARQKLQIMLMQKPTTTPGTAK